MKTFQEQKEFFDSHWPAIKAAVESGGGPAVVEYIGGVEDDLERRILYIFARQGLVMGDWDGKGFDPYIEVCDAGIAEMLRQAETAEDEETKLLRTNGAHIISYNLAADLADCWPDDDEPRTAAHFERGVKAADDCLLWCRPEVTEGLGRNHWARGMHLLSLGRAEEATGSFEQSLDCVTRAAKAAQNSDEVSSGGTFGVIIGTGYLGIARMCCGDPAGEALYTTAIGAFNNQVAGEDEDLREDAKFGIAQLETVREKYGKPA